jgi:CubicO group peptidase (beta-lactamase class C family)
MPVTFFHPFSLQGMSIKRFFKTLLLRQAVSLVCVFIYGCAKGQAAKTERIDSVMKALYTRGQFTGAVIVSYKGKIVYQSGVGLADREKKIAFTPTTQEYIGSLSKQFTAMGIMILSDRNKVRYSQSIRDFFPELPAVMQPVTIRDLLYHTSGLTLFDDYGDMTENDVLDMLIKQPSLRFTPGTKFEYCNAGYSLLGMLIERIAGTTLDEFMKSSIFFPLGMRNTEVSRASARNAKRAKGYSIYGAVNNYDTFMGGNASIISTAEDLYKWNQALYHFPLVKASTLAEALMPSATVMKNPALVLKDDLFGEKSYGFGWWVTQYKGSTDYFHDGAFSGYSSYYERIPASQTSVIIVSNLRSPFVYQVRSAIINILENNSYALPKIPGTVWLAKRTDEISMDSAVVEYRSLVNTAGPDYDFAENFLNSYGYVLLDKNKTPDAIKVFQLNAALYPNSFNVFDSLADGYEKAGDKSGAIAACKKALSIDPGNEYMRSRLMALEKNK